MGLFPRRDKHIYGDYSDEVIKDNFSLSDEGIIPIGQRHDINRAPHALTPDEVVKGSEPIAPVADIPMHSAGESLYKKMLDARKSDGDDNTAEAKSEEVKKEAETLLSRCSQFVSDDQGTPILTGQPAYSLDSIESIIAEAEKKAQERVKKMYGGDDVAKAPASSPAAEEVKTEKAPVEETVPPEEVPVEGLRLPKQPAEEIPMDKEPAEVKNFQYRFADEDRSSENEQKEEIAADEGATITFDAIHEEEPEDMGNTAVFTPVGEDTGDTVVFDKVEDTKEEGTVEFDAVGATMPIPELNIDPDFDIISSSSGKSDEEADEEEIFGDYETAADAVPIEKDLRSKVRKLTLRTVATFLISALLTVMATPLLDSVRESNPQMFLIISTAALALCAIVNLDVFKGLAAPFIKKCGEDTAAAISTVFSLVFGIVCIITKNTTFAQFGFISAIGMFFFLIGKRNAAKSRLVGFSEIANDDEKYALTLIDEEHGSYAIAHDAVEGEALIASGRKTVNVTRYLKNSQSENHFSGKAFAMAVITLSAAAAAAVFGFISESGIFALYLFTAVTAVGSSFSCALVGTMPRKMAANHLADYGAMITSYNAAEEIEQVNAVTFDVNSIFPRGRVKMYDMKVLSPNNLDETIFNAAAVTTSINSPLGHVFRRIARTSEDYVLPPADSVKYENRLGVSGWVGDHSVLIGNRTLMETHGVAVPSVEVDKKILRSGYFPVYVASDGRPCALLIVGYEADHDIENELRRLTRTGVVLLINNCDPNVTEEMLCDYFGLPEDFVKIMQSASVKQYKDGTEFCESIPAKAAYRDGAAGIAAIVTASIRMKHLTALMAVLHIILAVAGIAAALVLAIGGFASLLTPVNVALYLLASLIIVLLAPFFYRP
ncbi:MAG: hypothetical protein IJ426_02055 [Clostridia bacterium]|nr:hypothetical protein [Clostridia bacterium]